jgi:hypothetical protein
MHIIVMKNIVFVSAFSTLYLYGNYLIYKELSVKNKYVAIKYFNYFGN